MTRKTKILLLIATPIIILGLIGLGLFAYIQKTTLRNIKIANTTYLDSDKSAIESIAKTLNFNEPPISVEIRRCEKKNQGFYYVHYFTMTDASQEYFYSQDGKLVANCDFGAATGPYLRKQNPQRFDSCQFYLSSSCSQDLMPVYVEKYGIINNIKAYE